MGAHKITESNGDDHLSGTERHLWSLCFYCLLKFQMPVIFSVYGPNAPRHIDQHIRFFVPTGYARTDEVKEWLYHELEKEIRTGELKKFPVPEGLHIEAPHVKQGEDGVWYTEEYWWGTKVDILEYSGTELYLERQFSEPMFAEMAKKLMEHIAEMRVPVDMDKARAAVDEISKDFENEEG